MAGETDHIDEHEEEVDVKERIDICFKLAERARDRFTARQAFEWRYAFALWTLFAAGAAVIFTAGSFALSGGPATLICIANLIVALTMIAFYRTWLSHLDKECDNDQKESRHYEAEIIRIAGVTQFPPPEQPEDKHQETGVGRGLARLGSALAQLAVSRPAQPSERRPGHIVVVMHFWVVVVLAALFVLSPLARYAGTATPTPIDAASGDIEASRTFRDSGTFRIAIYGALLATCSVVSSAILGYLELRRRWPKVKVTIQESGGAGRGHEVGGPVIEVVAIVPAGYPHVKHLGSCVALPHSSKGFGLMHKIDSVSSDKEAASTGILHPGRRFVSFIEAEDLAFALEQQGYKGEKKVVGLFTDEEGHEYRSRPLLFDINKHRKQET
ncbi:MAG: hypothetical protein ABIP48_21160 [Planctomycetota bacterium]